MNDAAATQPLHAVISIVPAMVSLYEKQKKLYPRSVHGWFSHWRWAFVWATQLLFYGLFFVTAVAGRLWCGYACPQTVYTEIYLWVEHHIEGERVARVKLDAGPWNFNKLWRKAAKHSVWIANAWWPGMSAPPPSTSATACNTNAVPARPA